MAHHDLKTWPGPYLAVVTGAKRHEIRVDDRGFAEGDTVTLREWDPERRTYTGRQFKFRIGYLSRGPEWGLPVGLCVFSLLLVSP
jgi:hypothetical protein